MKRTMTAAICAVALLLSAVLSLFGTAAASRREQVYFMAVNDRMLELKAETMPMVVNQRLYVPYFMFDSANNSSDLGVFANTVKGGVMLYGRSGVMTFDVAADTVTTNPERESSDSAGEFPKGIIRNSTVFVPVDAVCDYFGLECALLVDLTYGVIVRVCSDSAALPNDAFSEAAAVSPIPGMYRSYLASLAAGDGQNGNGGGTEEDPVETVTPTPSQIPEPEGGRVYLAFRCDQEADLTGFTALLERYGAYALFFFQTQALALRDDEIRALNAAGHRIGLTLAQGGASEQAEQGNELLSHILRSGTNIALTEQETLPEGWFGWRSTVDTTQSESSVSRQVREILRAASDEGNCFVLLDDSQRSLELLGRLLSGLSNAGGSVRLAVETVLAVG